MSGIGAMNNNSYNTIVSSLKSPLYLVHSSPSHKPTNSSSPKTTTILLPLKPPKKHPIWKLHANAKGFTGRRPPLKHAVVDDKTIPSSEQKKNTNNDDDEEIPQVVFNRIIVRILVAVGAPLALGLVFLSVFGYVEENHLWDVPRWLQFISTFIAFGASLFGIAYGALSASLDPNHKGSFLGFEEARQHWAEMWEEDA